MVNAGAHCEVDLSANCSHDTCAGGARCVPLIRGGYRCELCRGDHGGGGGMASGHHAVHSSSSSSSCVDCDSLADRSTFCQLLSRRFTHPGSFLMFAPLKQRHRFNVRLRSAVFSRQCPVVGLEFAMSHRVTCSRLHQL